MNRSVPFDNAVFQEHLFDGVEDESRRLVTGLLNKVMKTEQMVFLGCMPYERNRHRQGHRNGYEPRRLETKSGSLLLSVPKVRNTLGPFRTMVFDLYKRYQRKLEEAIRMWVAFGSSTRKVTRIVQAVFGLAISPTTVSRIIAELDAEITTFHRRSLDRRYRYLFLDAKYGYVRSYGPKPKRGKRRPGVLLLAWGIDHRGREELVEFRVARAESEASWTAFLTDLEARGLRAANRWAEKLEMIVSDDHKGLESALAMVYPTVPRQLCVLHKVKNIADHLRDRRNKKAILAGASAIYRDVVDVPQARARWKRWAQKWRDIEPEAVENFSADFELTLRYLTAPPPLRSRVKTNNPLERFIRELNRKFEQIGTFANPQSWERATYLVWKHLKLGGYPCNRQILFTRDS